MSLSAFPVATRTTAFIAGASISLLAVSLDILKSRGVIPYDADSPELFPFVVIYFFITAILLVIDVRSIAPKELKTRVPGLYFPTKRWSQEFRQPVKCNLGPQGRRHRPIAGRREWQS